MGYFIKPGFWEKGTVKTKHWLSLDNILSPLLSEKQDITNNATSLVDGANIDISTIKSTLESSSSAITFTISYEGDDSILEVILNATSATYTFPATALCVNEGVSSGDNTLSLSGVSGDRYIIGIEKIGDNYYVICKNFNR